MPEHRKDQLIGSRVVGKCLHKYRVVGHQYDSVYDDVLKQSVPTTRVQAYDLECDACSKKTRSSTKSGPAQLFPQFWRETANVGFVVKALAHRGFRCEVEMAGGAYVVTFASADATGAASRSVLSEAVCLAALRARGVIDGGGFVEPSERLWPRTEAREVSE